MRQAFIHTIGVIALSVLASGAERKSWNRIHYVGGTIQVKTSPYDWNTTLTVTKPDSIVIVIAPAIVFGASQTVRIRPSRVILLSSGAAAWQQVAEVTGARLPAKPPSLFGLITSRAYFGIVYRREDGVQAAMLLESDNSWDILEVLAVMTGKTMEGPPWARTLHQ